MFITTVENHTQPCLSFEGLSCGLYDRYALNDLSSGEDDQDYLPYSRLKPLFNLQKIEPESVPIRHCLTWEY